MEESSGEPFVTLMSGLEPVAGVTSETISVPGSDGAQLTLYLHRPVGVEGPLPGMVHLHGGGMVLWQAADPAYIRWRDSLAAAGMVVAGVEFRNGAGKLGPHPYPAAWRTAWRRPDGCWTTPSG
jgi:dipeptidyl aminopeptidase/acylaminoacyl peptidase